ncbi:alpha/beta fold hydrolase [Sphingobium chlorophenolicum]|uniref:alpha/beta fold hydrolase n=1 Tax=Sphingobium chlorophenolicum TaxID=46429 RepID=UPI00059E4F7F|nr:alpha/beta hydrolase [Sphingobium chlorophenolicum]
MPSNKFVHIDGIRTHYLDEGEGRPVLLLHSGEFGACAELSWEYTIPALAKHYRVIAPDWLGYGETDKVYDFGGGQARMMAHMRRFMEIMELEESDVVGNSMGGGLFSRHMATSPDTYRIRSLVLIGAGGFYPDNEHRRTMLNYDCTIEGMKGVLRALFSDPRWSEDPVYVQRRFEASTRPGAWEAIAAARFKNPTVPVREFFGRPDETPYHNITVPTLIVAGDDDKLRLPGWEQELAQQFRDVEVMLVSNTGHCPHIERPDVFNEGLLKFLAGLDNQSRRKVA